LQFLSLRGIQRAGFIISCLDSKESGVGVTALHGNAFKVEHVRHKYFVGAAAIVSELTGGGVIAVAKAKDLLRLAQLLVFGGSIFESEHRRDGVAWTDGQTTI